MTKIVLLENLAKMMRNCGKVGVDGKKAIILLRLSAAAGNSAGHGGA
jgi:hypothetical protein